MQRRVKPCTHRSHNRRGIAPLELVLYLPIMLFVMALMMIMGTAGAWKARTHANARQAVWRNLELRTGHNDPHPGNWPASATMQSEQDDPPLFAQDPFIQHPAVRGPLLVDQETGNFLPIRDNTLDMAEGLLVGRVRIRRDYPILKPLPPHEFDFSRSHVVFDGSRWQFFTMGMASNLTRRVLFAYDVDWQARIGQPAVDYITAALNMINSPQRDDLPPLTGGDPEVRSLLGQRSPDFRPAIQLGSERGSISALWGTRLRPRVCEADPERIRQDQVQRLRDSIARVPERMTDYYIGVYQQAINNLQSQDPQPPGAAEQIAEWQEYIRQLQMFQNQL